MRELSTELKVGAFGLVVIAVFAFMTFKVGGLDWAKKKGYVVYAVFNSTAGLDQKTRVKIAGVDAGVVDGIDLFEGRARVRLRIDPSVKIYRNALASIRSAGLLGDKFLDIRVGSPDAGEMKDGETIKDVLDVVDMDDLARNLINVSRNFATLADSLNGVLGTDDARRSLSETIVNLRELTAGLNRTVSVNDQKLRSVLDNINALTTSLGSLVDRNSSSITSSISDMKDFSSNLKNSGPELIENLNKTARELRAMVDENRPGIRNTVDSIDRIARQAEKGEGTLGKLIKDDRLYDSVTKAADGINRTFSAVDRFRTFITFQAEYLAGEKDGKASFDITLQPSKDKYYILGVSGGPMKTAVVTETRKTPAPGTAVREEELSKKIRFNAQFAKRSDDAAVRIGLFENTFGIGGDYYFSNDRGKFTVDAWDFQKTEEKAKTVHIKAGVSYFVFRNLFITAGGDNLLSRRYRGGYAGVGVRFEDEDFKYLMGTLPRISVQ